MLLADKSLANRHSLHSPVLISIFHLQVGILSISFCSSIYMLTFFGNEAWFRWHQKSHDPNLFLDYVLFSWLLAVLSFPVVLLCACLCVHNGLVFSLLDNSAHTHPFMVPKACLLWKWVLFFCYDPCIGCFLSSCLYPAGSFLSFQPWLRCYHLGEVFPNLCTFNSSSTNFSFSSWN